jgi:glycosyltransferase involved in cell wall biosynthesis
VPADGEHASGVSERGRAVEWTASACVLVPAFDAARSVGDVIGAIRAHLPELGERVVVIDDGSRDDTAGRARAMGCEVLAHGQNRGKGAALKTGLATAHARGWTVALTVDADGQHPADEARRVLYAAPDPTALVLGVRDLARDGAPAKNRASNAISNYFLSRFARRPLRDTQCGLRRYPVSATLALGARGDRYDFEAEALLLASRAGVPIVELDVRVFYPPEHERQTHFHVVRDPARIIRSVVRAATRGARAGR